MTFVISRQVVLSQAPEGPLGGYIGSFADSLAAEGYAAGTCGIAPDVVGPALATLQRLPT
jgi:hypothetical protein